MVSITAEELAAASARDGAHCPFQTALLQLPAGQPSAAKNVFESSRPGEFHPGALPEPYVTVSRHTAPPNATAPRNGFVPLIKVLPSPVASMSETAIGHSLRSSLITRPSPLSPSPRWRFAKPRSMRSWRSSSQSIDAYRSEEPPRRTNLRPPHKRLVRFSVSRFHNGVSAKVQGWNQSDQANKPVVGNQLALPKLLPARVAPSLVA